ncbi:hypothetical protein OEV98_09945 [Caldibacillus lycopersici]|uniref:Uncharacterized protein n=1 Tax=Perspicuibacillus lycopersici TaxID=1325689 RepID=A0AAE3IUZ3_9BACI|nr:hypothetical protein [Perspicuibacillus lycopersici]MCU9613881.1 hypothetical protein [Perspicuibacillus lycopersici]
MNKPIGVVNGNKEQANLGDVISMNHYIFVNNEMKTINIGEETFLLNHLLHINIYPQCVKENMLLIKFDIQNLANHDVPIRILVENYLHAETNNYAFVSPKNEVLFLTDREQLYLTSGIIQEKSIYQYGILKMKTSLATICNGSIPFCPIGSGEVATVYSLEQVIKPKEKIHAYTWVLSSNSLVESDLLNWDNQLKSRLAFL